MPLVPDLALNALEVCALQEELNEALLVDIPAARAPADDLIARARAVDRRLRADSPPAAARESLEVLDYHERFGREWRRRKGRCCYFRV